MEEPFNISPLSIGDVFTVGLKTGLCIETTLQEILGTLIPQHYYKIFFLST